MEGRLKGIRKQIDAVDARLLALLREREKLQVREILARREEGLPKYDVARRLEVLARADKAKMQDRALAGEVFRKILRSTDWLAGRSDLEP